jgi:hypothetical protein
MFLVLEMLVPVGQDYLIGRCGVDEGGAELGKGNNAVSE